jgi:hypothetical protein
MSATEVAGTCETFGLVDVAEAARVQTSAERLQVTALIGSMLADIASPVAPEALVDGALANVAITLADRLVDDNPRLGLRAATLLSPDALQGRVRNPSSSSHSLAFPDAGPLAPFCALWDTILSRVGTRLAGQPDQVAHVASLLDRMHASEMGSGADRLPAKTLPIVFVGAVAGCPPRAPAMGAYRELGSLLALADDWQDLAGDIVNGHANQLLAGRHITASVRRVARPRRLSEEVAGTLGQHVSRTLAAASAAGPATYSKTHAFLGYLFQFAH